MPVPCVKLSLVHCLLNLCLALFPDLTSCCPLPFLSNGNIHTESYFAPAVYVAFLLNLNLTYNRSLLVNFMVPLGKVIVPNYLISNLHIAILWLTCISSSRWVKQITPDDADEPHPITLKPQEQNMKFLKYPDIVLIAMFQWFCFSGESWYPCLIFF